MITSRSFYILFILLVTTVLMLAASFGQDTKPAPQTLILTKRNTIQLSGPVDRDSVSKLQAKFMEMDKTLGDGEQIMFVLYTPGGDVEAGGLLIDTIKGLKHKTNTLSLFSASMGFQLVQNLGTRYVIPSGTLMSHRMKVSGVAGEAPGSLVVAINFILRMATGLDSIAASRMGLSLAKYQELVRDEYWVNGNDAVKDHAADVVVYARCANDIQGEHSEQLQTLFGPVNVRFSNCPLITQPLGISVADPSKGNKQQQENAIEYITELFDNTPSFIEKYIR
jgi:ATP-dependent protease ClpP protease subunit